MRIGSKARGGALMIEYVLAAALLATAAAGVASMLLSLSLQTKYTKFRSESTLLARALRDELANYVAQDRDKVENPPGNPPWHLPGDACGPGCGGKDCWALAACTHDVTMWLPERFRAEHGATASYTVKAEVRSGGEQRDVQITITERRSDEAAK